jgi:predicted AlkP superfamily phosphohydrolase/phosphomutase
LRSGQPEEILAAEKKHQAKLIEVGLALADHHQVDVLVVNLMLTDHANHKMPHMELVQEAYLQSDADLGKLCNAFQPDNVLLISDHGSSRLKGDFLLNVWLREHGYCVYQDHSPAQQAAAFSEILRQWFHNHKGWSGRSEKILRRLIRVALPRMPRAVRRRFWARIESAIPFAEMHTTLSTQPDFRRTPLFPGSLYSGLLYFNVAGREPTGVITAAEKKSLASKLKEELAQIREPATGERLFTNVFTSDELYHGPVAADAPDIIVDAYCSQWNIRTRQPAAHKGKQHDRYFVTFDQHRDFGWHSPEGVFIFSGPAIQPGAALDGAIKPCKGLLTDVPATLLHIYDVPAPEDWDGRVLLELLAPELSRRPIQTQPGDAEQEAVDEKVYSTEDADSMVRHLRALGYLD